MQKQYSTKQAKIKLTKKITLVRLENISLYYLQRFGGTEKTLRDMLARRIKKSLYDHPQQDINQIATWVDKVVESAKQYGYLNDTAYAKSKIAELVKKGNSKYLIINKLLVKGINLEIINDTLDNVYKDSELQGAVQYAKKRKLGIYSPNYSGTVDKKHMATMGRRGFAYDIAKKALVDELK